MARTKPEEIESLDDALEIIRKGVDGYAERSEARSELQDFLADFDGTITPNGVAHPAVEQAIWRYGHAYDEEAVLDTIMDEGVDGSEIYSREEYRQALIEYGRVKNNKS